MLLLQTCWRMNNAVAVRGPATHALDQGQGIPEDELELIFEPFYRVDKSRTKLTGGYGLGLSMCKTIIEAHGGRISVRSKPGEGAAFCISLPDSNENN